jgi:hypothetical protein
MKMRGHRTELCQLLAGTILNSTIYQAPARYVKILSDYYFVFISPFNPTSANFLSRRNIIVQKSLPIS